jgi:hypothetical protein
MHYSISKAKVKYIEIKYDKMQRGNRNEKINFRLNKDVFLNTEFYGIIKF